MKRQLRCLRIIWRSKQLNHISEYLYQKASRNKIPLDGTFELSPVCNFQCKMCYVRMTQEQITGSGKRLRTWEEWLALAKECKKAGMLYLLLTGGEPFLYPDFKKLYVELHKMGILVSINTNATMINDEIMEWLTKYPPHRMNITLYGITEDTYEKVCNNGSGYLKAVNNILRLKKAGITVVINASMIPENAGDLKGIIDFGEEHNIPTRVSTYMFPPVKREKEESDSRFLPEESARMYMEKYQCYMSEKELRKYVVNKLEGETSRMKRDGYMRCRAGRSTFWVSWDGTMTACGIMPYPLKVYPFERDFQECWMELTEKVRGCKVMGECVDCPKKELCEPCAAMLYAETGTTDQKAPYLCELAECIEKEMKAYLQRDEGRSRDE